MADLSASRVADWLVDLRKKGRKFVSLESGKEWFTASEAAAALGIKPLSVWAAVRRHRLEAKGKGRARRFPRRMTADTTAASWRPTSCAGYWPRRWPAIGLTADRPGLIGMRCTRPHAARGSALLRWQV
jgi:hypothetical protein